MTAARRFGLGLALLAWSFASGCGDDTGSLSVDLRTDLVAGDEFAHVQTQLARQPFGTGGESRQRELDVVTGLDFTRSVRVAEFTGVERGPQYLRVSALAADGSSVAQRDVTIDYGGDLALTVTITRSCRGVVCPGAGDPTTHTACYGGSCIDPSCRPEAMGMCTPPQCTRDDQCADGTGCLRGRCSDGACLVATDDSQCAPDQRCTPAGTCIAAPPGTDAGPPRLDAGPVPRDAGGPPPPSDAGSPGTDAGLPGTDAGPPRVDAGRDAGLGAMFCPENPTTRQQGAVFIVKLMHGTSFVPPPAVGMFTDVATGDMYAPWIEQLARDGITTGCGGGMFCPGMPLLRHQAAVFIVRAVHGATFTPAPATGVFSDVPTGATYAPYVEQLFRDGITTGCAVGMYCPDTALWRRQAAVMILLAEHGAGYRPPAPVGIFTDVPITMAEAPSIERFAIEGFTVGCTI